MKNQIIKNLARLSGATDCEGNRAESVFCFTESELEDFCLRLINESCSELDKGNGLKVWYQSVLTNYFGLK